MALGRSLKDPIKRLEASNAEQVPQLVQACKQGGGAGESAKADPTNIISYQHNIPSIGIIVKHTRFGT